MTLPPRIFVGGLGRKALLEDEDGEPIRDDEGRPLRLRDLARLDGLDDVDIVHPEEGPPATGGVYDRHRCEWIEI